MSTDEYSWFLFISIGVSAVVQAVYVATHPFPALGGGLFLQMAATVADGGALLPPRVPGYTVGGIPFAYPPLAFYVLAALLELGVDGAQVLRFGAPLVLLGVVWATYHLAVLLFDDERVGAVAGVVTGTMVSLNAFLVGASGFVRGLGFVFTVVALVGAYRRFALGEGRRALALAAAGWTLALLTHPVHAAATGIGVFAAWLVWDRSRKGFLAGAGVAATGVVLASPWWGTVVARHGVDVFLTGAGSHGSMNHSPAAMAELALGFWSGGFVLDWPSVLALLAGAVLLARGDWRRPVWLAAPVLALVPPHQRLLLLVVAPLGALGAVRAAEYVAAEAASGDGWRAQRRTLVVLGVLVVLVVPFVGVNALTAAPTAPGSPLAVYVDAEGRDAMAWIEDETDPDAGVVVVGDASEWFPYLADRTSVVVAYGTEWVGRAAWERHRTTQARLADCRNATCVDAVLTEHGFADSTDYVYVPRGAFVSNRHRETITPALHRSLAASEEFVLVYENRGVAVYRYENDPRTGAGG